MDLSLDLKEDMNQSFYLLPIDMYYEIGKHSEVESIYNLKLTCKKFNLYYNFEDNDSMTYEDYSSLILSLIHNKDTDEETQKKNRLMV